MERASEGVDAGRSAAYGLVVQVTRDGGKGEGRRAGGGEREREGWRDGRSLLCWNARFERISGGLAHWVLMCEQGQ